MMKRKIALMVLALPLGLSVLAKSASAAEFNPAPNSTRSAIAVADRNDRADQNRDYSRGEPQNVRQQPPRQVEARRPQVRRVWVPGHYERTARGRHWVPGHYETRR